VIQMDSWLPEESQIDTIAEELRNNHNLQRVVIKGMGLDLNQGWKTEKIDWSCDFGTANIQSEVFSLIAQLLLRNCSCLKIFHLSIGYLSHLYVAIVNGSLLNHVFRNEDILGPNGWRKVTAGLLKGSQGLEEISNFPWSRKVLQPEQNKNLVLRKQLDHNGLMVLSALLPRAASSLVTLDIG
jgi:hypothetical protein